MGGPSATRWEDMVPDDGTHRAFAAAWGRLAHGVLGAGSHVRYPLPAEAPARLEGARRAREGEKRTRAELLELPGWSFGERSAPGGPCEHVVVGPGGVFHLHSRHPSGVVELREGRPLLVGRRGEARAVPALLRRRVLVSAAVLSLELERACGVRCRVHGVVVLWSPFPQLIARAGGLSYVHGPELRRWLGGRAAVLDAGDVGAVAGALGSLARDPG